MASERWQQIESLFHRALEYPPAERDAFLTDVCADAAIRREVSALLQEDEAAQGYFDDLAGRAAVLEEAMRTADAVVAPSEGLAGRRIGNYLLERAIGRGGTSVVYLGHRVGGAFQRAVAVKILTRQARGAALLRRFEREQQVLSDLSHPHIASLYDGGVTEDGHSYFVMEYVDGCPIDQYCDTRRLSVEARLRLFQTVVAAVVYAHKHLIIHRDLKPSNILVANDGTVKLLDFGIAKMLADEVPAEPGGLTRTGDRWMTPDYAAPEQVRGERTTTATDVYQLGIVLYELLTGHAPHPTEVADSAYLAQKAVCETEPRRPSLVVTRSATRRRGGVTRRVTPESVGQARGLDVTQLQKKLSGDLDAIVLRALQKDVALRYGSAEALSRDVDRFLTGLPVEARQGKLRYHARKFLHRHRAPVAAVALGILLLVSIGALHVVRVAEERDRAQIEAAKAGEVTDFVLGLFAAGHPHEARGEAITAPMLLERGVVRAEALVDQPAVQAQILHTIARAYHGLADFARSDELFQRSLAIRREHLGPAHADVAHSLAHLGWSRLVQDDLTAAEGFFREALGIQRQALGAEHFDVANSLNGLGLAIHGLGRKAEAIRLLREALEIRRNSLGEAHVEIANGLHDLAILLRSSGDSIGAEALLREGLAMRRELLDANHPDIAKSTSHLASLLHAKGDYAGAEPLYLETVTIRRRALGEQHPATRGTVRALLAFYQSWGKPEKAASFGVVVDAEGETAVPVP
jgi:eukaryotic-like serine/threonine-protein kinase